MGNRLRLTGFTLLHLLLLVTTSELAFNRLASRELPPVGDGGVSWWHLALDHLGLFLYYFASALAFGMLARQLWRLRRAHGPYISAARWALMALGGVFLTLAALHLMRSPDARGSLLFELSFVAVVLALVSAQITRHGDLASKIGIALLAVPLTFPVLAPLSMHLFGDGDLLLGDAPERTRLYGQWTMVAAALLSPYCFAPRPLMTSAARLGPLVIAVFTGVVGVIILRQNYEVGMRLARHGLGIDIGPGAPEQQLTLYLVALTTIMWTLSSCLSADAESRRDIGVGLALIVLAGYGFAWPLQYLLGAVGLMTIGEAAARVRDDERALAGKPGFQVPPIAPDVWVEYVRALERALRKSAGEAVSAVTVRHRPGTNPKGTHHDHEGPMATTCLLTWRRGVHVCVSLERHHGAIAVVDILCGLPPSGSDAPPQWTLYALPEKLLGIGAHPEPPETTAPEAHVDDPPFAQRFRVRDAEGFTTRLLDNGLRARVTALVDGWLAYWDGHGLHYRVQPGQGAPLDHPIPITELAFRGAAAVSTATERVVTLVDLLVDIAQRGNLSPPPAAEPETPADAPPAAPTDAAPAAPDDAPPEPEAPADAKP